MGIFKKIHEHIKRALKTLTPSFTLAVDFDEISDYGLYKYCPNCMHYPAKELDIFRIETVVCPKCGTYLAESVGRVHEKGTHHNYGGMGPPFITYEISQFLPKGTCADCKSNTEQKQ